jgi:ribose 1,5-bisphosphokinase PhnN
MRANPDYAVCNVATQVDNQDSVYHYWASSLALRREYKDVFVYGTFRLVDEEHTAVFAYEKKAHRSRVVVALNWSSDKVRWQAPTNVRSVIEHGILLQSNYSRTQVGLADGAMSLEPWEAVVIFEENSLL